MGEPERLINILQQTSNPVGSKLVGRICEELERLHAADQVIASIREICALQDVPLVELPGMVEQLLSELADRQIRHDIEPVEFLPSAEIPGVSPHHDAKTYAQAERASWDLVVRFAWPSAVLDELCVQTLDSITGHPAGDPEDDEW